MSDVYDREKRIVHDREVFVEWIYDSDSGPPWKDCDGHGPVRESERSHYESNSDKKPGERPLNQGDVRITQFYYDWQGAMKKARSEGWGYLNENELLSFFWVHRRAPTKGELAANSVERDFQYLKGYLDEDWHYFGIRVTDAETDVDRSLWGIESNAKDYHDEVICQLADDMWPDVLKALLEGRAA